MTRKIEEAFDNDGILTGWYGSAFNAKGEPCRVFIPRRDQDIEEDRAAISALIRRVRK